MGGHKLQQRAQHKKTQVGGDVRWRRGRATASGGGPARAGNANAAGAPPLHQVLHAAFIAHACRPTHPLPPPLRRRTSARAWAAAWAPGPTGRRWPCLSPQHSTVPHSTTTSNHSAPQRGHELPGGHQAQQGEDGGEGGDVQDLVVNRHLVALHRRSKGETCGRRRPVDWL